jgi:hypothetical protein
MVDVNKLRKANELKGKITQFLNPQQIEQLAINRAIPHYELTNPLTGKTSAWFLQDEVYEWLKTYFVKYDFTLLPELIFVNFNESGYQIYPTDKVPPELSMVKPLYKLPMANLNTPPGVYFLCNEGKIIYIGKAVNVGSRLLEHKRNPEKVFDIVFFISCHLDQLLRIECACIKFFKPLLNITYAQTPMTQMDYDILDKILIRENCNQI